MQAEALRSGPKKIAPQCSHVQRKVMPGLICFSVDAVAGTENRPATSSRGPSLPRPGGHGCKGHSLHDAEQRCQAPLPSVDRFMHGSRPTADPGQRDCPHQRPGTAPGHSRSGKQEWLPSPATRVGVPRVVASGPRTRRHPDTPMKGLGAIGLRPLDAPLHWPTSSGSLCRRPYYSTNARRFAKPDPLLTRSPRDAIIGACRLGRWR